VFVQITFFKEPSDLKICKVRKESSPSRHPKTTKASFKKNSLEAKKKFQMRRSRGDVIYDHIFNANFANFRRKMGVFLKTSMLHIIKFFVKNGSCLGKNPPIFCQIFRRKYIFLKSVPEAILTTFEFTTT
jgi:hypothetical protein